MLNTISPRLAQLFLMITAVGVVHMGEQIVFGVEEYQMLRGIVGAWHALFPSSWADQASVLLITIVFASVSLMIYAAMRGGVWATVVLGLFGLLGVSEAHHWIEAAAERAYDPGLVTSFAYVWLGVLVLIDAGRGLRAGRAPAAA